MIKEIILTVILCLIGSISLAQKITKPTHYVVWIHGIGGNASQSGFMKEALENYLPTQDSSMNFNLSYFDYNTKNDDLSVGDFTKTFDEYLQNKFFKENPLKAGDKLSIIAHSQGGIITMYWLSTVCFDQKQAGYSICEKLTSLTTLGTPFWGSRVANLALALKNAIGNVGIMKDYGLKQLMALSVASPAIFNMQKNWENQQNQLFKLFDKKVRLMVVAGRSSILDSLTPFFPGENIEDDLGVPVTSTNPGFFLYSGKVLGPDQKTTTNVVIPFKYRYVIVDAVHIPQLPNLIKENLGDKMSKLIPNVAYPSLIDIPSDCIEKSPEVCSSPTLKYMASNILGRSREIKNRTLDAFAVQLRLNTGKSNEASKYIRFKVTELNNLVKIGKWSEPYSNIREVIDNVVYGYVTGSQIIMNPSQHVQGARMVNLEIFFGTTQIHKTTLKVSPGITTFVDLDINSESLDKMLEEMNQAIYESSLNSSLGLVEVPL